MARPAMEHHALCVPEVLESILLLLPAKDLLFAKRVCKHWANLIDRSSRLQEVLFFRAQTRQWAIIPARVRHGQVRDLTPFAEPEDLMYTFTAKAELSSGNDFKWNSFLFDAQKIRSPSRHTLTWTEEMMREGAPAQAMYFTQPPIPLRLDYFRFVGAECFDGKLKDKWPA